MSDGPHRSLPMRRAWCRVAERADKRSFSVGEISEALALAAEKDCRYELRPSFLGELHRIAEEPTLFRDAAVSRIEALRPEARPGLERAVLDRLSFPSPQDVDGFVNLQAALGAAVRDAANKRVRQVEEHYLRASSSLRAANVRGRLEAGADCADFGSIAARILGVDPKRLPGASAKQTGLDDGVRLR